MAGWTASELRDRIAALGGQVHHVRQWLRSPHLYPVPPERRDHLEHALADLENRLQQLEMNPTLLTVVLMGGTGVGKSTLLNALAGARVAQSGLKRPTTIEATVYHHRAVAIDHLDPVLRSCHLVAHDRPELRYKILVDTPDMDSSEPICHQRLREILPVADAVIYVGSQEKYHDRLGWDMLLAAKEHHAFAFILNKWDRCQQLPGGVGKPPDEDFRDSLMHAGFPNPLVFRTSAGIWMQRRLGPANGAAAAPMPLPGDDFEALEHWLQSELDERVIEDIKTKGLAAALDGVVMALQESIPPLWHVRVGPLRDAWHLALEEGVAAQIELLVSTADPFARDIERHFSDLNRDDFQGIFRYYVHGLDMLRLIRLYGLKAVFHGREIEGQRPPLAEITRRCIEHVPAELRQFRLQHSHQHLLALADQHQWPVATLREFLPAQPTSLAGENLARILEEELHKIERDYAEPGGRQYATRMIVKALCDWLPYVVLGLVGLKLLFDLVFDFELPGLQEVFGTLVLLTITLAGLHYLVMRTLPVRWETLRRQLRLDIQRRLTEQVVPAYSGMLDAFAHRIDMERAAVQPQLESMLTLRDALVQRAGREAGALFARR